MSIEESSRWEKSVFPLPECPICTFHYTFEEICQCPNGCLVCKNCLRDQIITNHLNKSVGHCKCMTTAECTAEYNEHFIKRAIGVGKKYRKWEEISTFDNLSRIRDPKFLRCPHCTFMVYSEEALDELRCENPKCGKVHCFLCNRETKSHADGECPIKKQRRLDNEKKENERLKDLEDSLSAFVQERMDSSTLCPCPRCLRNIEKAEGCNHIRCTCGCNFCYECHNECEEQDNPSDHFKPGKCQQYTPQIEIDSKLRQNAKVAAEAEWRQNHPNAAGVKLRVIE